jgi:hypothetical protein
MQRSVSPIALRSAVLAERRTMRGTLSVVGVLSLAWLVSMPATAAPKPKGAEADQAYCDRFCTKRWGGGRSLMNCKRICENNRRQKRI